MHSELDLPKLRAAMAARDLNTSRLWRKICEQSKGDGKPALALRTIGTVIDGTVSNPGVRVVRAIATALDMQLEDLLATKKKRKSAHSAIGPKTSRAARRPVAARA